MKKKLFAIMPFEEGFRDVFDLGIRKAAEECGYFALRVDDVNGPIAIHGTIIKEIYDADVIVADITLPSANVYYELGGSHAAVARNKTIMIARTDAIIPFDLNSYQVIRYSGISHLSRLLIQQIQFLEETPEKSSNPWIDFYPGRPAKRSNVMFSPSQREEPQLKEELSRIPLRGIRIFGKNLLKLFVNEKRTLGEALRANDGCRIDFVIPGGSIQFKASLVAFLAALERNLSIDETERFYNDVVVRSYVALEDFLQAEFEVKEQTSLTFSPFLPLVSMMFCDGVEDKNSYMRVRHMFPTPIDVVDMPRFTARRYEGELWASYQRLWDELIGKGVRFSKDSRW